MKFLELFFMFVEMLNLFFVVYLFFSIRKTIKLRDYVENLPPEFYNNVYRVSDLGTQQNIKSAVSSLGLKVGPGKKKVFKISGKF